MDKKKLAKIIGITAGAAGVAFGSLNVIAKIKKNNSVYENVPEEKNPLEGHKVIFVKDDNDVENADGVCGHLESVGLSDYKPGIYEKNFKRAIDVVLSFGGLVVLSPVYLGISLAIIIDDPGPVLFTQKRMGQNKKYFKLHKFRSMKMSTPHDVPTHMLDNPEQYITRVGKFLRAHSLDELPQIWDIFIGNMSVIGPRPGLWNQDILTAERDKYGANDVKPGLTGWAQINGRDELEIPVKAKLDGEYVKKMGFLMDVKCFLGSIGVFAHDDSVVEGGTGEMKKEDNRKKKYLIITNHSYMLWQFRKELIEELLKDGNVSISTPFVGHEDDFKAMGCKMICTEVDRRGINPLTDLKLYKEYYGMLRGEKPDMVITYSIKPNIYAGFACRQLGIQYCVNVQGLGTAFQKEPIATIVTVMYKIALKKAKTVFFENTANAQKFIDNKIIPDNKVTVLNGAGINLDKYSYCEYPSEENGIHFLFVGRIMKEKGVDELFEAITHLKKQYGEKIIFDMIGFFEDEYKEKVEQMSERNLIKFYGFQENPKSFYEKAHCIILPSYHEGMSNVLLEAAATGRVIITTDIPGCREAVESGKTGMLCEAQNSSSLECAIEKIIKMSEEERKEMGVLGRKKMEEEFDKQVVVQKTLQQLER